MLNLQDGEDPHPVRGRSADRSTVYHCIALAFSILERIERVETRPFNCLSLYRRCPDVVKCFADKAGLFTLE